MRHRKEVTVRPAIARAFVGGAETCPDFKSQDGNLEWIAREIDLAHVDGRGSLLTKVFATRGD
jgi:hypothetical protein